MDKIPEWLLWAAGIFAAAVFLKMLLDLKKDKKNEKLADGKQRARDARFITRQDPFPVRRDMNSAAPAADAALSQPDTDDDVRPEPIRRARPVRRADKPALVGRNRRSDDSTIIIVAQDGSSGIFPDPSISDAPFDTAREAPAADAAAINPGGGGFGGAGASAGWGSVPDNAADGGGDGGGD